MISVAFVVTKRRAGIDLEAKDSVIGCDLEIDTRERETKSSGERDAPFGELIGRIAGLALDARPAETVGWEPRKS